MVNSYDIETFIHNNKAIPYCVCLYFKNNFKNFYYKNNIILESIEFMFKNTKKQENNVIYIHNLNFDGFLIIESIENRALFFDSSKPHSSTTCTDKQMRINFNMNYF
jgi:hypothetical protein